MFRDNTGEPFPQVIPNKVVEIKSKILRSVRRRFWSYFSNVQEAVRCSRSTLAEKRLIDVPTAELVQQLPIIINNRNRYSSLKRLIERLEQDGYSRIVVLDNDSTYPPLLAYYGTLSHQVVRLGKNVGPYALWKVPEVAHLRSSFFVYTDSDVVPDIGCPADYVYRFLDEMRKNPTVQKVGFSLKIDDLPDCFAERESVVEWESRFWEEVSPSGFFRASIDTTFALYRPYGSHSNQESSLRSPPPYTALHLPWYIDSAHLDPEEQYYREHVAPLCSWWTAGRFQERLETYRQRTHKAANHKS